MALVGAAGIKTNTTAVRFVLTQFKQLQLGFTTRARILRYTGPASLCGNPAVTLASPDHPGGLQLLGPLGSDATLLALSASLGSA